VPDAAGANQFICAEKCDKTGTYKFRDIVSSKNVCVTECASKHFYETTDGEFVCLATSACSTSDITNDRVNDTYANYLFRTLYSTGVYQCKDSCSYSFNDNGTHKTCVANCAGVSGKTKRELSIAGNGDQYECVASCTTTTDYLFTNIVGDRQCNAACPVPSSTNGYDSSIPAQIYVADDNTKFCTNVCAYAYFVNSSSIKECKTACGSSLYLVKKSSAPHECKSACSPSTFYFVNDKSDRQCMASTVTTTTGCGTFTDYNNVSITDKVYFVDGDDSLKKCQTTCSSNHYMDANKQCVANCNDSTPNYGLFKEDGDNSMKRCKVNACTSGSTFKRTGSENICSSCDPLIIKPNSNSGSKFFISRVSSNAHNMFMCLSACPTGEKFIPNLPHTISGLVYNQSDYYENNKCRLTCPTTTVSPSTIAP
jgi:hypothetical protein